LEEKPLVSFTNLSFIVCGAKMFLWLGSEKIRNPGIVFFP